MRRHALTLLGMALLVGGCSEKAQQASTNDGDSATNSDSDKQPADNPPGDADPADAERGDDYGRGGRGPGRGGRGGFDPTAFFESRDADGDGKLSGDELPDRMRDNLDQIDTDKDGAVTLEEFRSGRRRMFGGGGRGGGRGGNPREGRPDRPQRPELEE